MKHGQREQFVHRFIAELSSTTRPSERADSDTWRSVESVLRAGLDAVPGLSGDGLDFARFVVARLEHLPPDLRLTGARLSDLLLAWAGSTGDEHALKHLDGRVRSIALPALRRVGLTEDQVAEAAQLFVTRILVERPARLAQYLGGGDLDGWIRIAATRFALNTSRNQRRHAAAGDRPLAMLVAASDPELEALLRRYKPHFQAAFETAMRTLSVKERALLRMCYVDGLRPEDLGRILRIHRTTAGRHLRQAEQRLLDLTRSQLRQRTNCGEDTLDSLLRLFRSHGETSLRALMSQG